MTAVYNKNMISLDDLKEAALCFDFNMPADALKKRAACLNENDVLVSFEQKLTNIKFLMRITRCVYLNKNKDTRYLISSFFNYLLPDNVDEQQYYNWQELKFVLFMAISIKDVKTIKGFEKVISNPILKQTYQKYMG